MSNLNKRLGPQGRSLLNLQYRGDHTQPTPQDLDFLINDLRFPQPNTTIPKILGYMYHYVPYVKYEYNLKLIIASFVNNPLCFGPNAAPMESNYMIIEVFKLITDKKLKISQPTLSIKSWYDIILKELTNFVFFNPLVNSWKALPIIAGLLLSNELRDQLFTDVNVIKYKLFFNDWDIKIKELFSTCLDYTLSAIKSDSIISLSLLSLAVTFRKDENVKTYTQKISSSFIIKKLIDLIFSNSSTSTVVYSRFFQLNPNDPEIEKLIEQEILQNPVVKHLNKLSFLLEAYFKDLPVQESSFLLIIDSLAKIQSYNKALCSSTQLSIFNYNPVNSKQNILTLHFWNYMKILLFSEVIIYQGILTRFLTSNTKQGFWLSAYPFKRRNFDILENEYKEIALKILQNLYYLNFILLSIGQGGFDNYNFVYYLTLELSLNTGFSKIEFENLTRFLIGNYTEVNLYPGVINKDYVVRCKVLFVLGLWENYLPLKNRNEGFIKDEIFPISFDLVNDKKYNNYDLIEASHSVLLLYFSSKQDHNPVESINYVQLLINQFPSLLSWNQLSIAIETLGKQILSNPIKYDGYLLHQNSAEEFLEFLYFKCINTRSGILIKTANQPKDGEMIFTSAQLISEVDASSNLSNIEKISNPSTDMKGSIKKRAPRGETKSDLLQSTNVSDEYKVQKRIIPETSREAIIVAFINLIPYLPLSMLVKWLDKIWLLIEQSSFSERTFLVEFLWKVLSENLDINRCELSTRWWYETKKIVENNNDGPSIKL